MLKVTMRVLFYSSIVILIGLVLWGYVMTRNWEEFAASAQKAEDATAKMAKIAFDKANRCVGEIYKPEQAKAEPSKGAKAKPGKPATPSSPRKSGTS